MELTTEVASFFTEVQAIQCCQALRAEGIEARFEAPATTGNYAYDWNMPTTEFLVYIKAEDLGQAEALLAELDFFDDPTTDRVQLADETVVPEDFEVPDLERGKIPLSAEDQVSKLAVQARNAAILSLLMSCLIPVALYLLISASRKPLRPQDSRNINIGMIILVIDMLWFLIVAFTILNLEGFI